MPTDINTTRYLAGVINDLGAPSRFLLSLFFSTSITSDNDVVDFDVVLKDKKLAPFVAPSQKGVMVREKGMETKTFRPAYIKPKTKLDPTRPIKRRVGESYSGTMSAGARREQQMIEIVDDHMEMIYRRINWMAVQAMLSGTVTVKGEGYDEQTVDFGRDPSLTKNLTGNFRWGESEATPLEDVEDLANDIQTLSSGKANIVIMDPKAWKLFKKDPDVKELLEIRREGSGSSVDLGPTLLGQGDESFSYKGNIGELLFYVYQEAYEDDDGNTAFMMPDYTVIIGGQSIEGVQCYAAIMDDGANYQAVEIFAKSWTEPDPAGRFVMSQSSPMVVPGRPNNSGCLTVYQ